jgi:3-oxoadipate enol-lactonase
MSFAEAGGVSIHYALEGSGPETVVLLHEMGGSLQSWDGIAQGLAERYTVLRYDQRGAGLSEKVRGAYDVEANTGDLEALLTALKVQGPFHFVAVAASASIPLRFAQRNPDASASQVLCNPAVGVAPARVAQLNERADLIEREGLRAGLELTLARSWPEDYGDPDAYRTYRARYLANDPWCFGQMNRALAASNADALLADVKCPTMVVAGTDDRVRPAELTEQFATRIVGARFETIQCGHIMSAQAPEALLVLLADFLGAPRA